MKLATLNDGSRDGALVVVSRDGTRAKKVGGTLQSALEGWQERAPALSKESGDGFALDLKQLMAPLPRAYEWIDGSAYINHIVLVRKARGAEPPATLKTDPLMYQGGGGAFLVAHEDVAHFREEDGIDYEAEVAVITDDVPMGVSPERALTHVKLLLLANDVTLRNLVPAELEKGFGFLVSKPATAFSPFAVTPDELGAAWKDGRVHLPLVSHVNGVLSGDPQAGPEMHFHFGELIAHAAKTRRLPAGSIIGSGTVSNEDPARGVSCLAERRMREKIATGVMTTPFLRFGDRVRIEMKDAGGASIFGAIDQRVVRAKS